MAHTPLPWQWIGFERHPSLITTVPEKPNGPKLTLAQFIEPADAEFAVHCVMCHADLLAAAKVAAILIVQGYGTMGKGFQDAPADHVDAKRRLEAAIAKATE